MIEVINAPGTVEEVRSAFLAYNEAIERGDGPALNGFFWDSPHTVRFGPAEHLFGYAEISTFRTGSWKPGPPRTVKHLVVTALGDDCAATSAVFVGADGKQTRQSQVWGRMPEGWRIVA